MKDLFNAKTVFLTVAFQASACIAEDNALIEAIESNDFKTFAETYARSEDKNSTFTEDGASYPLLSASMALEDPRFFELVVQFADPNHIELGGLTPLFTAPIHCTTQQAKALVARGADINHVAEAMHLTPLHMAAASQCYELADYLIGAGANTAALTKDGKTPADTAREKSDARMLSIMQATKQ